MVFGLLAGLSGRKQASEPSLASAPAAAHRPFPGDVGSKSNLTVNEFVARTKRQREKGLEPTKPELIAYARYLGIDPIADGDLIWIAEESLDAPLPSEWTEHHDSADRVFYYNVETRGSSWTHPLEQLHRDTYKNIVAFRNGGLTKEQQLAELEKLRTQSEDSEREAHDELQAWTEHVDDRGQKFYYDRARQRSVWTDPRPAVCHTLYLGMKALRVMSKHCGQAPAGRGPEDVVRPALGSLSLGRSAEAGEQLGSDGEDTAPKKERRRKKKRKDREASAELPKPFDLSSSVPPLGAPRGAVEARHEEAGSSPRGHYSCLAASPSRAKIPAGLRLAPLS